MGYPNITQDIQELETRASNLENTKVSSSDLLNLIYPVGSIYMSVNNVSPSSFLGGTWVAIENRFLLSAGSSYAAGSTGGVASHTHEYGIQFGGYYRDVAMESNTNAGCLQHGVPGVPIPATSVGSFTAPINSSSTTTIKEVSMGHYCSVADTSITTNMPPYLTVYMWKRTA